MSFIVDKIKWIMQVSGALTCTMIYAAIAPQAALQGTFGETLQGPLAEIVVRNWGVLITVVGAMLIYGAYRPESRTLVLSVAIVTKFVFIALVLAQGGRYLGQQAGIAIAIDAVWLVLFACYLVTARAKG
jgi:hypothetical protein